jgi:hypothetical protein
MVKYMAPVASGLAAKILSPSLSASMRDDVPSALVTMEDEGKQGSDGPSPGA